MLNQILGSTVLGIAGLFGLGYVLPEYAHHEREIIIDAPPETVFVLIEDFDVWESWANLSVIHPQADVVIDGEGIGQTIEWQPNHTSTDPIRNIHVTQELVAMAAPARMVTRTEIGDFVEADTTFMLDTMDDGTTRLRWAYDANSHENTATVLKPFAVYTSYLMGPVYDAAFKKNLANLKRMAEAR